MATRIKRGDTVVVIAGKDKGSRGTVLSLDRDKQTILVEGLNLHTKSVRRSQDNPQGGLDQIPMPLHFSNVMLAERYDARRAGTTTPEQAEPEASADTPEKADS